MVDLLSNAPHQKALGDGVGALRVSAAHFIDRDIMCRPINLDTKEGKRSLHINESAFHRLVDEVPAVPKEDLM